MVIDIKMSKARKPTKSLSGYDIRSNPNDIECGYIQTLNIDSKTSNGVMIDRKVDIVEEIYVEVEVENLCPFITLKELFGTLILNSGGDTINETNGEMMEIESYKKTCKNKYVYKLPIKNIHLHACCYSMMAFHYDPPETSSPETSSPETSSPTYIHDCSKMGGCKDAYDKVVDKISPRISKDSIGLIKEFSAYSNTVTGIKLYLKCLLVKDHIRNTQFITSDVVVSRMHKINNDDVRDNRESGNILYK